MPLVKDSEPIRLFEMPTSPSLYMLMSNSTYKLGDVGISRNLIGSISLTKGHCPCTRPRRWIMKQWPAGVNSRFAEVTENDILHNCEFESYEIRNESFQR